MIKSSLELLVVVLKRSSLHFNLIWDTAPGKERSLSLPGVQFMLYNCTLGIEFIHESGIASRAGEVLKAYLTPFLALFDLFTK